MSILSWIADHRRFKKLQPPPTYSPHLFRDSVKSASDRSQSLWTTCGNCGSILYMKHLEENQRVCCQCQYHLSMTSCKRITLLCDLGTWRPLDSELSPSDPLAFVDKKSYKERAFDAQQKTGLNDAMQTGTALLGGIPIALGVMDFQFMGGSMGSVVGEKITRLIEYSTKNGLPIFLVSASGGARMQEGILSLMQMAKISSALQKHQHCAKLLYVPILTSPTTGGVTASFAMLGDLIIAEPGALIGFAGRRVIEQTIHANLPEDFQTSEYLLEHGLIDLIIPRSLLKQAIAEILTLYRDSPRKKTGTIMHAKKLYI